MRYILLPRVLNLCAKSSYRVCALMRGRFELVIGVFRLHSIDSRYAFSKIGRGHRLL